MYISLDSYGDGLTNPTGATAEITKITELFYSQQVSLPEPDTGILMVLGGAIMCIFAKHRSSAK
jgi:hypothetical protein